ERLDERPKPAETWPERGADGEAERTQPQVHVRTDVGIEVDPADVPEDEHQDEEHQERDHHPGVRAQTEDRHRLTVAPANRGSPAASSVAAISQPPTNRPSLRRNSSST